MRKVSVNVYQFDELSDDAKKKALENLRYVNVDGACDDWYKWTIEDFKADLSLAGFMADNVRFTGFCSQGDGASFTGKVVNFKEFCKKTGFRFPVNHDKLMTIDLDIRISRQDWRYCHKYTVSANIYGYDNTNTDEVNGAMALERFVNDWEVEQADILYSKLEQEYDCLTSDDEVIETIKANKWEFNSNGKIWRDKQ